MTGVEKIVDYIARGAACEVEAVEAETRTKTEKIRARYDAQARREAQEILERGKARVAERRERLAGAAQLEAKKLTLAAKQEMLDRAFDLALEKLLALPREEYISVLAKLAVRASTHGQEQIVLAGDDRELGPEVVRQANGLLVQAGRTAELTLSGESGNFRGGLLLLDGDTEVNCTFLTLVRLIREGNTAGEIAGILFG